MINIYDPATHKTVNMMHVIKSAIITSLYRNPESNKILIGTYYDGLFIYDWQSHQTIQLKQNKKGLTGLASNYVTATFEDNDGKIWIGYSDAGLDIYDPVTRKIINYRNNENDLHSLGSNSITKIISDREGKIWIATPNFLNIFNEAENNFTRVSAAGNNSLVGNIIMELFEDSNGNLWVGTEKSLNLYHKKNGTFSSYNIHKNSESYNIMSIREDKKHYLWISSHNNIYKFNPVSKESEVYEVQSNGQLPGFIPGSSVNYENYIFFGGSKGVYVFSPDEVVEELHNPPVYITGLSVNYSAVDLHTSGTMLTQNISYTEELKLNYRQSTFALVFNALEYASPEKIRYAYMLEGFDDDWNYTSNLNWAVYTKVSPGTYTFRVIVSDNKGRWDNSRGRQLKIIISPPFWGTLWFRITVGSVVFLIISILIYSRSHQQIKKQRILKELIAKRTEELYEANIILTDHHEELIQKNEEISSQNEKLYQLSEEILKQNAELEKHRMNLEQLVAERTKQLELAKVKAEESDRLKSAFLANMSHEIRTPMNAIVGFASLLKDNNYTLKEKNDFVEIITSNSEVLLVLIQDILDLSLIEANQIKMKNEMVDLNEILDTLYSSAKMMNKKESLVIKLNNPLQKQQLKVNTDKVRIKQIITNLLNNAYKFTETGFIELGTRNETGTIVIYVRDSGIGISEDELPRIFDRFRKSEAKKNTIYRGAGLGLAISKALARLLGIVLKVKSELGTGSEFSLVIPATKFSKFESDESVILVNKIRSQKWTDKNILIVEDEKANYTYLRKLLDKTSVKIHWAQSGIEAVKIIETGMEFNLVIMDIKMPDMDGFEATKIIKAKNKDQCVIALTAYARPEDRTLFNEAGFDDYLAKPVKPLDFMGVIGKYF